MTTELLGTAPVDFAAAMTSARAAGVAQGNSGIFNNVQSEPVPVPIDQLNMVGRQLLQPTDVDGIVSQAQSQVAGLQQQATAAIAAAQPTAAADSAAFIAAMEAAKAKAKQQMDATIDDAYAKLNEVGQQHLEAQSLIVQAMQQVAALGAVAAAAIGGAFDSAINVADEVADAIAAAASAAASAIVSAADTVADGFESIFSGW